MDDGEMKVLPETLTGNSSNTFRAPSKLEDSTVTDSFKTGIPSPHGRVGAQVKLERPLGNRVAVRKYREKKKAENAYLEEEVKKLWVVNRVLIRKLQVQGQLQAEAVRLRRLLIDLKGLIGDEIGVPRSYKLNCNGEFDSCIRRE